MVVLVLGWLAAGCFPGDESVGRPCREKEECSAGLCLQESRYGAATGWLGGYCTARCSASCAEGICTSLADGSYCLESCTVRQDCRSGYVCHPEQRVCMPDCLGGWPCGGDLQCGPGGICWDPTIHVDGGLPDVPSIGEPCQSSIDCENGYCIEEISTESGIAWKDGMCSADCSACHPGTVCVNLDGSPSCLPACNDQLPCRNGYVCNFHEGACLPDCRLGFDCGPTLRCNGRGICAAGTGYGK